MGRTFTEAEIDWNYTDTDFKGRCKRMFRMSSYLRMYANCYGAAGYPVGENHNLVEAPPLPQCTHCLVDIIETLQKYSLLYSVKEDSLMVKRFEGIRFKCPPEDRSLQAWTIPTIPDQGENQDQ